MSKGSTFYINYYEYENKYDIKSLMDSDRWAKRDIERLEEEITKLKAYRQAIFNQAQIVSQTEFKTIVKLTRQKYNFVDFYISVYETPVFSNLEDRNHPRGKQILNEKYPGKERSIAIKRANELVKQYNATLIKNF